MTKPFRARSTIWAAIPRHPPYVPLRPKANPQATKLPPHRARFQPLQRQQNLADFLPEFPSFISFVWDLIFPCGKYYRLE